ncbi:MAG: protein translocase subunit SecF [Dehalococcoidales bacterium]|jgi:preprotein translocase subunit SecF|nr:protein translocase subunit SecF [Dehalococcoidales bacterium]|tara:strand:- start:3504 stop:4424 length:921 start_codon:yes stop_codon:yes gene_type:complete
MIDITGKRSRFFLISIGVILICIISLAVFGLELGVEFSSGSMMTVSFEQEVKQNELEAELVSLGYSNALIQKFEDGDFLIRLPELSNEVKAELEAALITEFGIFEGKFDKKVSPMVATETTRTAAIAVAIAAVGVLLYITWAFRHMPKPFRYGACAIVAIVHDALIALGVFSIIGGILGWEINLMFITGLLAVIGYSVNNTVVVFDRIRENLIESPHSDFEIIVNNSLMETLARSLNTSLTTIIVVLALLLFVGSTIQNFTVVLLIGIIAGTFSSLFIAPLLLVVWEKSGWRRFTRWIPTKSSTRS